MWVLIIFICVIYFCVKIGQSGNLSRSKTQTIQTVPPTVKVEQGIIDDVLETTNTALGLASQKRGTAFLRVSIISFKGQGLIEFYHCFTTSNRIEWDLATKLNDAFSEQGNDSQKLKAVNELVKAFDINYYGFDSIVEYFTKMKFTCKFGDQPSQLIAQRQVYIPENAVQHYYSAIRSRIQEKWPYLHFEEDMGDIDITIIRNE